ncbi:MAG: PsiF family protein [Burkholderiaceae bacterium]
MKPLFIALSLTLAAGAAVARPAPAVAPPAASAAPVATAPQSGSPQRSKMKICNADAKTKNLHGDERRVFMKQCLSAKPKPVAAG